ncbi:hypothetical protein CDL12_07353 [Handroanthus impetiginosus]|uniref:NB-ARC domain-containing protein n=1 Tax=Handroanthus impetiginosus TaxID=429701 RepID=A0A2G9HR10_9LAMI|nr:hypothetical protein CDL12_07353 [Handroanthus impetiginosus]
MTSVPTPATVPANHRESKSGWEKVLKGIESHLGRSETSPVPAILKLNRLIRIWIAEGQVQQKEGGLTMEEIGGGYLNELINRNMLSIRKAKEEINFEILKDHENVSQSFDHKPRHRVTYCSTTERSSNKQVRSLFLHRQNGARSQDWKSFKLLRVLEMVCSDFRRLDRAFGALVGLSYLALRHGDPYHSVKLTEEIGRLKYLESDVRKVRKMTSLRKLGIELDKNTDARELCTSLAMLENLVCLNLRAQWCECIPVFDDRFVLLHHLTRLKLEGELIELPSACNFPPNLSYLTLKSSTLNEDPMPVLEKLPKLVYLKLYWAYKGEELMVISRDGFPTLEKGLMLYGNVWICFVLLKNSIWEIML